MAKVIKEIRLILADIGANSNKFWTGKLFDDNTVITEWGRVGKTAQSKTFPGRGQAFLEKKKFEKEKKGYSELKTVATNSVSEVNHNGNLKELAREQIKVGNPVLQSLVDNLVAWNIHQITSSTQITYNASTGLFSTPLGIVTQDAIEDARNLLAGIKSKYDARVKDREFNSFCNQYFRLIPQDVGMKFNVDLIFGGANAFQKQSDLLDSLASSYAALKSAPVQGDTQKQKTASEQVFNVDLELVDDGTFTRIVKKYVNTRKDSHVCSHLKVRKAYKVRIGSMADPFAKVAPVVGNVQELWHGTKKANLLSILKSGLRVSPPSTAAIAGKLYGNGVYFASDSTKSLNYSYGYWHGGQRESHCFMFLASVALGKQYIANRNRSERYPVKGYDSTWAKGGLSGVINDEFIVYQNNQCNLEYLVEFA